MSAVIFDLDGTLVDSAPDIHAAAVKMLKAESLPEITYAQTRSFIGNGVPKLVERIMSAMELPADPGRHAHLVDRFMGFYDADPATLTRLYPGVPEALARLQEAGLPMALCTNKPEAPARKVLSAFDLDRFFPVVIGGDTLPVKKPDPAPLRAAMEGLGVSSCLYVGDSEVDAATAAAIKVPFALYTEGYRRGPASGMPHTHLFDHFDALPALALPPATRSA